MARILHITTHLGGGVGAVLLETLKSHQNDSEWQHEIIVFEELSDSEKKHFKGFHKHILRTRDHEIIQKKISQSDIIQIEWWNHPLIYLFLLKFPFPKCRISVCSHISGFHRPQIITKNVVNFSDIFLATTKATLEIDLLQESKNIGLKNKIEVINYPMNFQKFKIFQKKDSSTFNIGYVGTLDYSKLHRNFLSIASKINIPNSKFILCGEDIDDKIYQESLGFSKARFVFNGLVENIVPIYEQLDVLGYPLNPNHYGTGEQVIREAMFLELPIVAFNNPCERSIIKNGFNGLLVRTEKEYVKAIESLYNNKRLGITLGKNARHSVLTQLNPDRVFNELGEKYSRLLAKNKSKKNFLFSILEFNKSDDIDLGAILFIESLGHEKSIFLESFVPQSEASKKTADIEISNCEIGLRSKNKGGLFQYLRYFPDDKNLNYWADLINQKENSKQNTK
jgi:glycosyltransferase involved in cell wall biosynthesis